MNARERGGRPNVPELDVIRRGWPRRLPRHGAGGVKPGEDWLDDEDEEEEDDEDPDEDEDEWGRE